MRLHGLAFAAWLLAAGQVAAQGLTIAPWTFVEPPPATSGLVLRCERSGEVLRPDGTKIRLRAASEVALQPPGTSTCTIAIEGVTQVTVAMPTRVRLRMRLHGSLRADAYSGASILGTLPGNPFCNGLALAQTGPGAETVSAADSAEMCLEAGTTPLRVSLRASAYVQWGPAYDTSALVDCMSGGDDGFVLELIEIGSCTPEPPPEVERQFGIYADAGGASCNILATLYGPGSFYVLALGASGCGLSGAEFRIRGFPPEWFATVVPNSRAQSFGNPLQGGANLGFIACQGAGGPVVLYRIDYFPMTVVTNHPLSIEHHSSPSCASFCCPFWSLCDPPVYTKICVPTTGAVLNGTADPCAIGAEPTSWSAVKGLYRR